MKKILLASTILVGTAGFAAADNANFTFSGEAWMGVAYHDDGVTTTTAPEVTGEFTVGMMTTTDGGLEAGASVTIDAGGVSMNRDYDETDGTFGDVAYAAGGVGDITVYIDSDYGKLEAAVDGTSEVTFTYTYSFSSFDVEAYYIMDPAGGDDGDMGAKGTYTMGDYSVWVAADYDDSASATTFSAGGEATFSGFTVTAEVGDLEDFENTWEIGAEYAMGAYTVGGNIATTGGLGINDYGFEVYGKYDLGGGVGIEAGYVSNGFEDETAIYGGVSMSF